MTPTNIDNWLEKILSDMAVSSVKHALEQFGKYGNNATVNIIPQIDAAKAQILAHIKEIKRRLGLDK